jgi:hypothetical protein
MFFLEDADPGEMEAYLDLLLFSIIDNMDRQDTYLRYPSAQLRRQIMEEATSIAIAEQCTNARIQQTVRDFKKAINYDDTFVQTTTLHPTTTMTARTSVTDINTPTSPDILLMLSHRHDDRDDQISMDIEHYRSATMTIEDDLQRSCESELKQMEDDIIYEDNALTDRIIADFERISLSDDVEPDAIHDFSDDMDENTDTDDGNEHFLSLENLLPSTSAYIQRQKGTIARLRSRISRLGNKHASTSEPVIGDSNGERHDPD